MTVYALLLDAFISCYVQNFEVTCEARELAYVEIILCMLSNKISKEMMEMSGRLQNILDNRRTQFTDSIVKELLKSYIHHMPVDAAKEQLGRIVSPESQCITVDHGELAVLIENAKAAAGVEVMTWNAQEDEPLLKDIIAFMKDDFLPSLDGTHYVTVMPAGMGEFLLDCLLEVSGGGVN